MKKLISLLFLGAFATLSHAQSAKIAIVSKAVKGQYMQIPAGKYPICSAQGKNYIIAIGQEEETLPANACKIVTWTAADGHGYISLKSSVHNPINVRKSASKSSSVITKLTPDEDGCIPEAYECLGKQGDWYKLRANGKVGYILSRYVDWTINDADCAGCIR